MSKGAWLDIGLGCLDLLNIYWIQRMVRGIYRNLGQNRALKIIQKLEEEPLVWQTLNPEGLSIPVCRRHLPTYFLVDSGYATSQGYCCYRCLHEMEKELSEKYTKFASFIHQLSSSYQAYAQSVPLTALPAP